MLKKLTTVAVSLFLAAPCAAQVTIDFTTYDPGTGNVNIFNWLWSVTLDGSGGVVVTDENFAGNNAGNLGVGADPTGFIDGNPVITYSGSVPAGITGSFDFLIDSITSEGFDGSVLIDGDGTGVGVTGRNATRIDWDPGSGDAQSEELTIDFSTAGLIGGYLIATGAEFTNLDAPADPVLRDFTNATTTLPLETESAVLGGDSYTLAPSQVGQIGFSDGDTGETVPQGYALASITFDLVILGDIDSNGVLEANDVDLFVAGWNSDTSALDNAGKIALGDVNLDGVTNMQDWGQLRAAFAAQGITLSSSFGVAVPEPSSSLLALLAGVLGLTRQRLVSS